MTDSSQYDPVYLHARREALVVIGLFCLALVWSVGNYYLTGYVDPVAQPVPLDEDARFLPTEVSTLFGMPTWVVTGIVIPWLLIDIVAFWFCYYYMADDDLGEAAEDTGSSAVSP